MQNHAIQRKLFSAQRSVALRIVSAYYNCLNECCVERILFDASALGPWLFQRVECRARTVRLRKVGRGKRGPPSGAELIPDTMVSLMLQFERFCTLITSFATLVMKTKELDGHRERNNGEGQ